MPNFFAIFDVSLVTVVGLLGILGLRTEGPESFSPSDVCSESSSEIASSSSSSEDGSYLLPFSSSISEFEPKLSVYVSVSQWFRHFLPKTRSCKPISQNKTRITDSFLVILGEMATSILLLR
jgi:hypothetical protein